MKGDKNASENQTKCKVPTDCITIKMKGENPVK